jgi:hypothetical protein
MIMLIPSEEVELMFFIPPTLETALSMGLVTLLSIVCGLAPLYEE